MQTVLLLICFVQNLVLLKIAGLKNGNGSIQKHRLEPDFMICIFPETPQNWTLEGNTRDRLSDLWAHVTGLLAPSIGLLQRVRLLFPDVCLLLLLFSITTHQCFGVYNCVGWLGTTEVWFTASTTETTMLLPAPKTSKQSLFRQGVKPPNLCICTIVMENPIKLWLTYGGLSWGF